MKTLAKFLLRLSLAVLPCLTAACTSEVETVGETPGTPENPQANDPNRRSVVISLQNKLILVNGTPENHTAMTRDGIAEDDENRIESFDIYAFGSDKEEGPYTFQERFAYRAEAGNLPVGVSPLDLKSDEAAGKVNVVFYPRKGLFTKFYCVANQTKMNDATGHEYIGYTPLQQSSQQASRPGDAVTTPGIPTENDFIKLNTPLLEPTGFNNDILLAPLPMSGANGQPVDLREYSMGTYVRLNISLTRAVARFDVVNDAAKSHFAITDISMGNGRQGVTLFPIRAIGDVPATPGQLITYPYRPFDGLNANAGTTTKAFYCYPCKAMDDGFLILKGLYAVNLTDEKKEVSYRIPFERASDGNGTRIEINHNHRYTVQITEADPFELTANIRLVDWETGDYIDDYEPDNGLDVITVSDLTPAETAYDVNTNIVTLALTAGSNFTVATGSNAGVEAKLSYYGGTPETEWLNLEEIPVTTTRAGGTQQVKYKVSFKEDYMGDSYPRGILRLIDKAGSDEEVILIDTTFGVPTVETTAGTMNPDGINNWDAAENTLYLVQATGTNVSTGAITVKSIGGSKIELPAGSGITVSPASSTNTTQEYTFKWASTDATDLTEKELAIALKNYSDETKIGNVKVKLLPNRISNLQLTNAGTGISLSDITATTATLTMPIIKDRQFTITMDSYNRATVSKCPAWLENITPPTTRSTPESKTTSFTFKLIENAANFDDTQIVFTNASASGGIGMTVNIVQEFQTPTVTLVGNPLPTANTYSGTRMTAKQVKSGATSTYQIKVYSLGGNDFYSANSNFIYSLASTESNSTKIYRVGIRANTYSANGTFNFDIRNLRDASKKVTHTIEYVSSRPTMRNNSPSNCIEYNVSGDASANFYVRNDISDLYGKTSLSFSINSPGGLKTPSYFSGNFTITNTHAWSTSEPWDTFQLATSGRINMSGGNAGNVSIGSYTFESKASTYFQNLTIAFYNRLPIGYGVWATKINGVYCARAATYIYYESAVEEIARMGNGWYMPGWPNIQGLFGIGKWSENSSATKTYMSYFSSAFSKGKCYTSDFAYNSDNTQILRCGIDINNINTGNNTATYKWVLMDPYAKGDYYAVAIHN